MRFIKGNPLLAAVIALVLLAAIYYGFSSLWAGAKIAYLDHQNTQLQAENTKLASDNATINQRVVTAESKLADRDKELEQKDALLQSISTKVVSDRKALDDATATAARIMDDESPLTRDELREKLCGLYNIPPNACK